MQRPHPPILIGGGERRTLRLVARYGDACNIPLGPDPESLTVLRRKLDVLREHCAREGTDYDRIEKTVMYVGPTPTSAAATDE